MLLSDKLSIKDNIINQGMIFNNMKIIHTSLAFSNNDNAKQRSCRTYRAKKQIKWIINMSSVLLILVNDKTAYVNQGNCIHD